MRESIGGTWLLGLVLTFIVFFASFLALSVNYSKAFNIKNNVVDLVEKYEGNNCAARKYIASYMKEDGYLVYGNCPAGYTGYGIDGKAVTAGKALYCIETDNTGDSTVLKKHFYRVMIFFKIDLPVVGGITTMRLKGETASIYWPSDQADTEC